MNKPFSNACAQNQTPILTVLSTLFKHSHGVLEIGSGTGQHAVFFGAQMPHLEWYTSDRIDNHAGIQQWLAEARLSNVHPPVELDVSQPQWPELEVDAVFSANTLHIMAWPEVERLFGGVSTVLPQGGRLAIYGPFNYGQQYTSDSNARFDIWLKQQDPNSAIRNFEDLDRLANQAGLELIEDTAMPANNRILCWQKRAHNRGC